MKVFRFVFILLAVLILSSCGSSSIFLVDSNCLYEYDRANNVYRLVWVFKAEKNRPKEDSVRVNLDSLVRDSLSVEAF